MSCSNAPNPSRIHVAIRMQVSMLTLTPSRVASHWLTRIHLANTKGGAFVVIASKSTILLFLMTWTINVSSCAALGCRGPREGAGSCSLNTWLPCRIVKQRQRQIGFDTPPGSGLWPTTGNAPRTVDITLCTAEARHHRP